MSTAEVVTQSPQSTAPRRAQAPGFEERGNGTTYPKGTRLVCKVNAGSISSATGVGWSRSTDAVSSLNAAPAKEGTPLGGVSDDTSGGANARAGRGVCP